MQTIAYTHTSTYHISNIVSLNSQLAACQSIIRTKQGRYYRAVFTARIISKSLHLHKQVGQSKSAVPSIIRSVFFGGGGD